MKSLSDPSYPAALAWFEKSDWHIEYDINHVTKKVGLSLMHGEQTVKSKTIPLDNNLVIDTQQSILNLYNHFNTKKDENNNNNQRTNK